MVVVEAHAGGRTGLGYTYCDRAAAGLVKSKLAPALEGEDAMTPPSAWAVGAAAIRNVGRPGVGFMALSAVDTALWDLKARLLELPLVDVLPAAHFEVPVYGSGGFCNLPLDRLREQLGGWAEAGIPRVKMKVGRRPEEDPARLHAAREAIGPDTALYVDANGAFSRKEAAAWAERYAAGWEVSWFEEPVSSADFTGLRQVRDRAPASIEIAAGEYAFVLADFRNLLAAEAVDCLQADVTRCGGITGLLRMDAVCRTRSLPFSAHCAPAISVHACAAMESCVHIEYFHDHTRIESMLFDGVVEPEYGALQPDSSRPGLGLELRESDAKEYAL
jgi:L-alanine-DL-glutamate epimerase-like enolase superfamily enzyme